MVVAGDLDYPALDDGKGCQPTREDIDRRCVGEALAFWVFGVAHLHVALARRFTGNAKSYLKHNLTSFQI
jgi:hypothetical protein